MGDITITVGMQCDVPDEPLTLDRLREIMQHASTRMNIKLADCFAPELQKGVEAGIQDSIDKMIRQQVEWHAAQRAVIFPRLNPITHPALPMFNLASILNDVGHLESLLNQKIDEALNE